MRTLWGAMVVGIACRLASGQDANPASRPHFEVASIRPFSPRPGLTVSVAPQNPEHLVISTTLRVLIQRAYGVEDYQLIGPSVLGTSWEVATTAAPGTTVGQANLMLQSLIEERFHLTFHHETKEFKAYNLVVAKGGPKLKDSIPTDGCFAGAASVGRKQCGPLSGPVGIAKASGEGAAFMNASPRGVSVARNFTLGGFARGLRYETGEIVIDKTGIEGVYDIRMEYSTVDVGGRPFNEDSPLPSIFDALPVQLGLKLEPTRAVTDVMMIDHLDSMPTDN